MLVDVVVVDGLSGSKISTRSLPSSLDQNTRDFRRLPRSFAERESTCKAKRNRGRVEKAKKVH